MRAMTRLVALVAVASLCLFGLSDVASASKNPVGSAKWCKNHPHTKLSACSIKAGGGGGTGGGGTGGLPSISVRVSPSGSADPLVETGESEVRAVVQVETSPLFFNDEVSISSLQLANVCGGAVLFGSLQPGAIYSSDSVEVLLDADGNATVSLYGLDCTPGASLIEADLVAAPYLTATGFVDVLPPAVTTPGVFGSPAAEVETGNTPATGISDVYSVFYVETDPVYAEQPVVISSTQLANRCLGGVTWLTTANASAGASITGTLDNDGNVAFTFTGSQCAPGDSLVTADIVAGIHSTYITTYTIAPPTITI
ncbi:MAG TPA: hypothetical protein VIJ09_12025 [Acidimicrobiales bacterium]